MGLPLEKQQADTQTDTELWGLVMVASLPHQPIGSASTTPNGIQFCSIFPSPGGCNLLISIPLGKEGPPRVGTFGAHIPQKLQSGAQVGEACPAQQAWLSPPLMEEYLELVPKSQWLHPAELSSMGGSELH